MPGGTPDAARGSGPARVSPSRRAPRVVRQQVRLLIEACWADDGRARPRASHVAEHVGSIELALTPAQRQWLDCPAGHRPPEGAPAVLCRGGVEPAVLTVHKLCWQFWSGQLGVDVAVDDVEARPAHDGPRAASVGVEPVFAHRDSVLWREVDDAADDAFRGEGVGLGER